MAVPVSRALIIALRIFAAKVRYLLVVGPRPVRIGRVCQTAALVDTAPELLDSKDAKEQENEEHEEHSVAKIWQRA